MENTDDNSHGKFWGDTGSILNTMPENAVFKREPPLKPLEKISTLSDTLKGKSKSFFLSILILKY